MSVEYIMRKRFDEHLEKEKQRWVDSIPLSLSKYTDYSKIIESRCGGRVSMLGVKNIEEYVDKVLPTLILHGSVGLGKTAVGIAVISELFRTNKVRSALYVNTPTFLMDLSSNYDTKIFNRVISTDVLLLDDVGAGSTDLTTQRKLGLWAMIDRRWTTGKSTIITTNLPLVSDKSDTTSLKSWIGESGWSRLTGRDADGAPLYKEIVFRGSSMRANPTT